MVEVPMGVDDEIHRAAAKLGNLGFNLGHELRKLIIDDQHAIFADADGDVAA